MYLLLVSEIFLLFFTSRVISKSLFAFFYTISHSKRISVAGVASIFFLGTVIHELAHYLTAKLLFVEVGKLEVVPELHENGLKLGSVQIAKTDIGRRFLIGVAPLIIGTVIVCSVTYYLWPIISNFQLSLSYILLTTGYLLVIFVITNTMFSSRKDMEGAIVLVLFLLFVLAVLTVAGKGEYLLEGTRYVLFNEKVKNISEQLSLYLLIPLGINILCVLLGRIKKY